MNRIEELKQKRRDVGLDDAEAKELDQLLAGEAAQNGAKPVASAESEARRGGLLSRIFARRMRRWELCVIAVVVLALCVRVSIWWFSPPDLRVPVIQSPVSLFPTIQRADAGVTVERDDTSFPGETEFELQSGDVLLTVDGAGAAIEYEDTTNVTVNPATRLVVQPSAETKNRPESMVLRLESGTITTQAASQPEGRSFVIRTPNARIEVAGTRFTTTSAKGSTRVQVQAGRVELTRVDDGKSITISAGQYAVVAEGTKLTVRTSTPLTPAPIALYRFNEGQGDRVHDTSGFGKPLNLIAADPQKVRWLGDNGLLPVDPICVSSDRPALKIYKACQATNEITVEAWISPAIAEQQGPARIVSLSADHDHRNFTLGHGLDADEKPASDTYVVRMRTSVTDRNGRPATETQTEIAASLLTHIVFSYSATGKLRIYTDGICRAEREVGGDFSTWDPSYRLLLGDELNGDRAWFGSFHRLAVYDRAFTEDQVQQSFAAGPRR